MSNLLNDKVTIITGESCGICKTIAWRFAEDGCNLMLAFVI